MGRVLLWIAGILGLAVAGIVVAIFVIDWTDQAESMASAAMGREVKIGSLDFNPGWTTTVHATDLDIANTEWGQSDALFALEEGSVSVRVWPLIMGRTEIPEIVLRRPVIALEKDAEGKTNWDVGAGAEAAGEAVEPDERSEVPLIGRLIIEDGKLSYRDVNREMDLQGRIETAKADVAGEDSLSLSLDGTLQKRPLKLTFKGGSALQLRETEKPYPVDVDLRFAKTHVRADGTITDPVKMAGLDINFAVEGPTLADVFPIFRVPLPDTPPYSLAGDLTRDGDAWRFQNFAGKVGDSDLAGSLSLDQGQTPPFLKANLVSKKLDFADLAGLVGAEPDDKPKPEAEQFPNAPIAADRLHAMNMDVNFKGTEVIAPNLPLDRVEFHVKVDNGRAEARPIKFALADGTVSGEVALNARQEVPSADAALKFENLDLKPFFKDTQFVQEMGGRFSGSLYVLGVGKTPKEMMETGRGEGAVAMRDGSISGLIVEAAGLDVAEALALVVGEDARVPIRCGRIKLDVQEGTVDIKEAVIDTTDSLLVAQGNVRPADQTFDMQIEARAKDFSLIDVAAPVSLSGSFKDPSIAIGGVDPLPFFETGGQEDIDCDKLVSGALEGQFKTGQEKLSGLGVLLKWTAFLGAGALIAVTAMTSAARLWWVFDLFTHFRLQYVIAAMVLGAVAVAAGARGAAMALALVLVVHGWAIKDLWVGGSADADAAGVPLRIVSANVLGSNPTPDKVLTFVRAAEADLVVLVEVGTERWDEVRSELGAFYPYQAPGPGQERDPVRLYSRHPVLNARVVEPEGGRRPYLEAELAVDTGRGADPVVVIGVHPPSPSPSDAADSRRRNLQLDHIAETVANQVSPLIVAGDFNTSPWSPHFRDLLAATGLRNAADGHGWIATWPAWLWPARVPIDHVLIRGPVIAADVRRGPFIGSDHYPLIADLSLAGHVP